MAGIEIRSSGRSGATAAEIESSPKSNLFVSFVEENRENFTILNNLTGELRQTRKAWQLAYAPIQQGIVDTAMVITHNTGLARNTESRYLDYVFGSTDRSLIVDSETEGESEDEEGSSIYALSEEELKNLAANQFREIIVGLARNRRGMEGVEKTPDVIRQFKRNYDRIKMPIFSELDKVKKVLWNSTEDFMLSSYQALIDTQTVLSDSNSSFGRIKDEVGGFLGGLMAEDEDARRRGEESLTMRVRSQWQESARTQYDPVLFERFWQDAQKSGRAIEIMEWLNFLPLIARAQRDESKEEDIAIHDIESAIGRVAFEKWPRQLREPYTKFGLSDAAIIVEKIRSRCRELFPQPSEKKIFFVGNKPANSLGKKDRQKKTEVVFAKQTEQPLTSLRAVKENENDRPFYLARSKYAPDPRHLITHAVEVISEDAMESEITKLASYGETAEMKRDFYTIIKRMINDSSVVYGPAASQLIDLTINTVKAKKMHLRRLDPKKTDIRLEDPQTMHARIVFAIDGTTLIIYRLFPNHQAYSTHFNMKK